MQWNLKRLVDVSLVLTVCAAPLFLGGRYAFGRLAFVTLAAVAAIAYAVHFARQPGVRWRSSRAQWLFLAAAVVVGIQLVPLPQSLIDSVHPTLATHLPLWTGDSDTPGAISRWDRISLYPHVTLVGLAMLGGYSAIFLVALQRLETVESIERMLRWIGVGAVAMAAIGILQYVAGNGKFLWWYEHPFRSASLSATGTFDNNNHFAHFLALGLGPVAWWLATAFRSATRKTASSAWGEKQLVPSGSSRLVHAPYVPLIGMGVLLFGGLMSTSRGGALVIVLAMATCSAILYFAGSLRGRSAAALGLASVLVCVGLGVHGFSRISRGLDDLTTGSIEDLDREGVRRAVWSANVAAIAENPLFGVGVGTHQYFIPIHLDQNYPTEFSHAECGYLQVLTETGLAGGAIMVAALAVCGWWSYRSLRHARSARHLAVSAAVVSGLVASVVHSIWDFPWYIPATMAVTCLLAACLCRLAMMAKTGEESDSSGRVGQRSRGARAVETLWPHYFRWSGVAATIVAGTGIVFVHLGPALASPYWDSYLRRSVAWQGEQRRLRVDSTLPPDQQHAHDVVRIDSMISDLEEAARHHPQDARVHLRLAGKLLTRYEYALRDAPNEMPINQLRDAAAASPFSSLDELHAWIERAVGAEAKSCLDRALDHVHRAHQATPLEPEGYLHLADLAFLEGAPPELAAAHLDQARRTDPHDGDVLVRSGVEAFLQQDFENATTLWQSAYNTGPECQRKMIRLLAGHVPVAFFLEKFQPDLDVLEQMEFRYSQLQMPQELTTLRRYAASRAVAAAREAESSAREEAADLWMRAHVALRRLEEMDKAAACGRRAVLLDPQDFRKRRILANTLSEVGAYAEAEEHFRWCVNRKPEDVRLKQALKKAMADKMRTASAEAARQ